MAYNCVFENKNAGTYIISLKYEFNNFNNAFNYVPTLNLDNYEYYLE